MMRLTRRLSAVVAAVATIWVADSLADSPTYKYNLTAGRRTPVCEHMLGVFNKSFAHMWDAEPLTYPDDAAYGADSKYAFPLLPGTVHQTQATFEMRYSKVPTSPEFDAIKWREGRVIFGDAPATLPELHNKPMPVLVAYFDFDNDGRPETVIKIGFSGDYSYNTYGHGEGLFQEHLLVLNQPPIDWQGTQSLWELQQKEPQARMFAAVNGTFLRPFIYSGHTYVARYNEDLGPNFDSGRKPPNLPRLESMTVVQFHNSGRSNAVSHQPMLDSESICEYKMTQTSMN